MSSNLPVTTVGGLVSIPAGDIVPGHQGGDVSLDRGASSGGSFHEPGRVDGLLALFPGLNLSAQQQQIVLRVLKSGRVEQARSAGLAALDQRQRSAALATLRKKWGDSFDGNLIAIDAWLYDSLGPDVADKLRHARHPDGSALFNDLAVIEAVLAASRKSAERASQRPVRHPSGREQQRDEGARLREIENMMAAPRGSVQYQRYYGSPELQAEYRELLGRGSSANTVTASADGEARIAHLESLMSNPRSDYYRYESLQQEYRDLIERREQ